MRPNSCAVSSISPWRAPAREEAGRAHVGEGPEHASRRRRAADVDPERHVVGGAQLQPVAVERARGEAGGEPLARRVARATFGGAVEERRGRAAETPVAVLKRHR
jgi:hypothetical protein